jgi:hypothetical protein
VACPCTEHSPRAPVRWKGVMAIANAYRADYWSSTARARQAAKLYHCLITPNPQCRPPCLPYRLRHSLPPPSPTRWGLLLRIHDQSSRPR